MRGIPERAALIGGTLAVWSEVGTGTEIELRLPGRSVYANSHKRPWWSPMTSPQSAAAIDGEPR